MSNWLEDSVSVRYLIDDVQAAIAFYTTHLRFTPNTAFLPAFAEVTPGNLRLLLAGPDRYGYMAIDANRHGTGEGAFITAAMNVPSRRSPQADVAARLGSTQSGRGK